MSCAKDKIHTINDMISLNKISEQENTICKIHNMEMKKKRVKIFYGLPSMNWSEYDKIKDELFPNCDDPVAGGCVIRFLRKNTTKIYICENCNIDRNKWKENNLELWKMIF